METDPIVISPRAAAILLEHLPERRLRVAYRADAEVYPVLIALAELAMSGSGHELALVTGGANDFSVTVLQAARKAGRSPRTIVRAINEGQLEAKKVGPIWSISEQSLRRWLARRERAERAG